MMRAAFSLLTMMALLSASAEARVCVPDNPTIVATQAQFATLSERLDAIENPFPWLQAWISASGTLAGSSYDYNDGNQNGTWSVTSDQSGESKTASGDSMCSNSNGTFAVKGNPSTSNGQYCWCKMDSPRVGAWVFSYDYGSAAYCATHCAGDCAGYVRGLAAFRAPILSLP